MGKGCRAGPENAEGSTFICSNKNRKGSCLRLALHLSCVPSIYKGWGGGDSVSVTFAFKSLFRESTSYWFLEAAFSSTCINILPLSGSGLHLVHLAISGWLPALSAQPFYRCGS